MNQIKNPINGKFVLALLLLMQVYIPASVFASPKVNGKLEQIGPFRVLRVWGTPDEMGYAHGSLVWKEFVGYLEESLKAVPVNQRAERDKAMLSLASAIKYSSQTREELEGMFRGIVESAGGTPRLALHGRELQLEDLMIANAGDMLRAFGCSGFVVWGEAAGDDGVIAARNFDYLSIPSYVNAQMILVRKPAGAKAVATIAWPGYLGAVTAINEDGVCVFLHDGDGSKLQKPNGQQEPLALALKDALESSAANQAVVKIQRKLQAVAPYPFSYMVRVVTPRLKGSSSKPARVFRIDASGLGENPIGASSCITTNHYLKTVRSAVGQASEWSLERFAKLQTSVESKVTRKGAWEALGDVAVGNDKWGTLHSLVVYPERRELDLAFGKLEEKVIPATASEPYAIRFDELFGSEK